MSERYNISRFTEGQLSDSKGVTAGMWCVEETVVTRLAFFDTEEQARAFVRRITASTKGSGDE